MNTDKGMQVNEAVEIWETCPACRYMRSPKTPCKCGAYPLQLGEPTTLHDLKTWPQFFERILTGEKTFEVRKNDRRFKVGDVLVLREFEEWRNRGYTGRSVRVAVTYITDFEQKPGFVVMAIKPI
jgi:hypothetical protein